MQNNRGGPADLSFVTSGVSIMALLLTTCQVKLQHLVWSEAALKNKKKKKHRAPSAQSGPKDCGRAEGKKKIKKRAEGGKTRVRCRSARKISLDQT